MSPLHVPPQEAFLDLALPTLGATLRALEAEAERSAPDVALRRRLRWLGRRGREVGRARGPVTMLDSEGGMFRGLDGRLDRRKEHVRELDARVEELVTTAVQRDSDGVCVVELGGHAVLAWMVEPCLWIHSSLWSLGGIGLHVCPPS